MIPTIVKIATRAVINLNVDSSPSTSNIFFSPNFSPLTKETIEAIESNKQEMAIIKNPVNIFPSYAKPIKRKTKNKINSIHPKAMALDFLVNLKKFTYINYHPGL